MCPGILNNYSVQLNDDFPEKNIQISLMDNNDYSFRISQLLSHLCDKHWGNERKTTNPNNAEIWASIAFKYYDEALANAEIELSQPLDIFDFEPWNYTGLLQLLNALNRHSNFYYRPKFRLLPVFSSESDVKILLALPEFSAYIQTGMLVPLLIKNDQFYFFDHDNLLHYQSYNPLIVLFRDAWSRMQHRIIAIHYGNLLEADIDKLQGGSGENKADLWRPVEKKSIDNNFSDLLDHYLSEFNSTPVLIHVDTIYFLNKISEIARQGYLIISLGEGYSSAKSMRMCGFPKLIENFKQGKSSPVNFQLIAHLANKSGASVKEIELDKGHVLQLIDGVRVRAASRLDYLISNIDPGFFYRSEVIWDALKSLRSDDALNCRLNLLRLSSFDPSLFSLMSNDLVAGFIKFPEFDRKSWRIALEHVWSNHVTYSDGLVLHPKLAPAAMHCGHWSLARESLHRGISIYGENASDLANLAWCDVRTGKLESGYALVTQALNIDENDVLANTILEKIQTRLKHRDDQWLVSIDDKHLPLTLEPLDSSHAEAFFYQYRDPQIAIMTGLPVLNNIAETRTWIAEQESETGRVNFAVMHHNYGFVSFINLAVSEHAAFFCFWTGIDYQGAGFATAAGRLVCKHAASLGVNIMLTSAYKDNQRSVRALQHMGFSRMSMKAKPPDQDRIFFSLIDGSVENVNINSELVEYYAREKLPMEFVIHSDDENLPNVNKENL